MHFGDDVSLRNDVIRWVWSVGWRSSLFDRLLVNLTQPIYLCFKRGDDTAKESTIMKCKMEVGRHLRQYKQVIVSVL